MSTSVPPAAASHGCYPVTIPAMNRVWSQLLIGERQCQGRLPKCPLTAGLAALVGRCASADA
jgi:hypothetical protein